MSAPRKLLTEEDVVQGRSMNIAPETFRRRFREANAETQRKRELRMILMVVVGIVVACMVITIFR